MILQIKRRLFRHFPVLLCAIFLLGVPEHSMADDGPTFAPTRSTQSPVSGQESIVKDRYEPFSFPEQQSYPDRGGWEQGSSWSGNYDTATSLFLTNDPVALIPQALNLANRYGIFQCIVVLTVVFIFQYVRNTQKSAIQREEFFRQQLEYSDRRTTEELTRLAIKLGELDQGFRSMQEKFERHSELIRTNAELSREIVSTMTAHNHAVEKGIAELSLRMESRPIRTHQTSKPRRHD